MTTPQGRLAPTAGQRLFATPAHGLQAALVVFCVALTVLVAGAIVSWWLAPVGYARPTSITSLQAVPTTSPTTPPTTVKPSPTTVLVIPLGRRAIRVPILEYHYIRVNPNPRDQLGFNLSVTPTNFSAQMNWLASHGYHPITFDNLRAYFEGKAPLPARPVVLTFDDGYLDFFTTAFPILQAHRFKAVSYIVPGFLGGPRYMTPAEVTHLDRSGLVEIGSHTVHHVNLITSSPANRSFELDASKKMLEGLLRHPVLDFCYPSGDFNAAVVAAVGHAGYVTATTQLPGIELAWSARLIWPRVRVSGGETLQMFVANLGQPEPSILHSAPTSPTPSAPGPSQIRF